MSQVRLSSLSKAKAQLSKYGKLCHKEPIIVTVNGQPSFQLVPLEEDDDLINQLLEHNPQFRELLAKHLRERKIPAGRAMQRL